MKRLLVIMSAFALAFLLFVPAALAANPDLQHTGRVLVSTGGDVTLPAGEHADAVIVVRGHATIAGEVNTLVVVDGSAALTGARAETVVAVGSPVTIGAGTVVTGDVMKVDSLIERAGNGQVNGSVRDMAADLTGLGFFLGPLFVALFIGFALAAIAAALLLAAVAARQVRAAEQLISREPVTTAIAALAGIFLPILVVTALFVTVVGAPLAVAILVGLWPFTAFLGYLVAAIWVGDWLLGRMTPTVERERPYAAAIIGIVVLQVLAIWPLLSAIPTFFGFGAVLLLAWRTIRGRADRRRLVTSRAPAPAS